MKHTDFQGVLAGIKDLGEPEREKIETGLTLELELERGELDEIGLQEYKDWREWLRDHSVKWHDWEKRYTGHGDNVNFLKGELWIFLHHFKEYLAECDNCGRFFVKTNRRPQRFCKHRGERACRDEYQKGRRKTPEGRKERAIYMRELRATRRRLRKARQEKKEREELKQIPDAI